MSTGTANLTPSKESDATKPETIESKDEVVKLFEEWIPKAPDNSFAIAAIHTLLEVLRRNTSTSVMGIEVDLKKAATTLKNLHPDSMSLTSSCDLFFRYVTRTDIDTPTFAEAKSRLLDRGMVFANSSSASSNTIHRLVDRFVRDGQSLLVHGNSPVVISALLKSASLGKHFSVIVTEGRPKCSGYEVAVKLKEGGISVTLVADAAVGYIMDKVDFVMVGAEGVVENGGVVSEVGTYQVAMIANALKKPVYVLAEFFKFARLFPLNQHDLPDGAQKNISDLAPDDDPAFAKVKKAGIQVTAPTSDYTPPSVIELLFTDLGIFTPSAVSDELIKLYYGD